LAQTVSGPTAKPGPAELDMAAQVRWVVVLR
jgi:hypothetical protein